MIYPQFDYEKKFWQSGLSRVVGIDEAGRGPLAGPVVAGAVALRNEQAEALSGHEILKIIRDSKTLSALQREKAYEYITANFIYGVGISDEKTIDRINILEATYLSMKKAITDIKRKLGGEPEIILIDGRSQIPNLSIRQENLINADKHIFSVSAASIIAKVTRDRLMLEYSKMYPAYGFEKHKGYGTKAHFQAINEHGPCEIHRLTFID